jgi:hypothetical protein
MILVQIAAALFLARLVAPRWWDFRLIGVLTAGLVGAAEQQVTGDVSRYLPDAIWSDGSDSEEQIIHASAASTILLPLIVSALAVYLCKLATRARQRP